MPSVARAGSGSISVVLLEDAKHVTGEWRVGEEGLRQPGERARGEQGRAAESDIGAEDGGGAFDERAVRQGLRAAEFDYRVGGNGGARGGEQGRHHVGSGDRLLERGPAPDQ